MKYRKEIDGLRAIAVLPVIFFHGGLFGITGGYVGVDIFFVISGYLITTIIIEEIRSGRFSILNFYERRARRILPALSMVLIFTTIAAYILMPANYLKSYSQSLVSVATFSSNVFFYLTSGYFSTASDEKPLLHTWSLAVEEQFYIFFPVLISVLWFIGKKRLTLLICSLSIASFLLSQYLSVKQLVDANFYLIFSRAWELLAGVLIAIIGIHHFSTTKIRKNIYGGIGLVCIIYSIIFFNKQTPFPSIYTLVPVIGTLLIIIFSDGTTVIGKLIAKKLFVGIGLISYSLYLWHQPLFAFLRMKTIGEPSERMFIIAIVAAFILSVFSYRYIERPFRNKRSFTRKRVFQYSVACIAVFLSAGLSGHILEGYEWRFAENNYLQTARYSPKRVECHTKGEDYLKPESACRYAGSDVTWASFGDSHTVEPAYALAKLLEHDGKGLLHLSFSGCPPALFFETNVPGCSKWVNESLTYLEKDNSIKNVLLGFRYSGFLFGDQLKAYPEIPDSKPVLEFFGENDNNPQNDEREIYWQSFSEIVRRLLASGKKVYLLYPIPELPTHIAKAIAPISIFGSQTMLDLTKSTSSTYYFARNNFILNKLDTLPYGDNLHAIKPFEILCSKKYCPAVLNKKALYFDDDHLSVEGSKLLITWRALGHGLPHR
ncbi:MAG: acyltransferase [Sedimenticola sp.]|nr:acyltransferase [Sedimenticola sp.]